MNIGNSRKNGTRTGFEQRWSSLNKAPAAYQGTALTDSPDQQTHLVPSPMELRVRVMFFEPNLNVKAMTTNFLSSDV